MQAAFRESTLKYRDTIARVLILPVQNTGVVVSYLNSQSREA